MHAEMPPYQRPGFHPSDFTRSKQGYSVLIIVCIRCGKKKTCCMLFVTFRVGRRHSFGVPFGLVYRNEI